MKVKKSNKDYFNQPISEENWRNTYKWETDESIYDTFERVADGICGDDIELKENIIRLMVEQKYSPAGRILSNAGTDLKGTSMINCFVSGFSGDKLNNISNVDSIDSIYSELKKQAKILKSEGGYGFNVDALRPRGAYIEGVGVESPGSVEFLKLWNVSSKVVTSGSGKKKTSNKGKNKIRKGAMMVTKSLWHPDIIEFIKAKRATKNDYDKFNMSVLVSDKFMEILKKDENWDLIYPDFDACKEEYDSQWDGNIDKWIANDLPIRVYDTIKASELWDMIMESNYNWAEPGVIFIDRVNKYNNLRLFGEIINAPNPCGEQYLPPKGSCNLGHFIFTGYLKADEHNVPYFDFDAFKEDAYYIVKFHDNVLDKTLFPLPEQKEYAELFRRLGIGYMGYGSMLNLLGMKYGCPEALEFTNTLGSEYVNNVYLASSELAKERGSFPGLGDNVELFLESEFIKQSIRDDVKESIRKNGIRNAVLTTIAPTGNTGIVANNVSGGIEPVFGMSYNRWVVADHYPDGLEKPFTIDFKNKKALNEYGYDIVKNNNDDYKFKWKWEEDEHMPPKLISYVNKIKYAITEAEGLRRLESVMDYSKYHASKFDLIPAGTTVFDLEPEDHITTLDVMAKYIDNGISKTINVPNDYPYEDFKNIYIAAYEGGHIKGLTTYRDGSLTGVLVKEDTKLKKTYATRPKELEAKVYSYTIDDEKWMIFVGLKDGKPFELFGGKENGHPIPEALHDIAWTSKSVVFEKMIKKDSNDTEKKSYYRIKHDGETIVEDFSSVFNNESYEALTRMISMQLRLGVDVHLILEQLHKAPIGFVSFERSISRALKEYIKDNTVSGEKCPNCGEELIYSEGCLSCKSCGASKCG